MPDQAAPRLITVESGGEKLGYVAIDTTIGGQARGGLRLMKDLSEWEIRDAARAMTLKYGLLGVRLGGAKAGVFGDPVASISEKRARMLAFGKAIEPLLRSREYVPDADMGTTAGDVRWMVEALGLPVLYREWRDNQSGYWTACSVAGAVKAALRFKGESLAGRTVAIEGYGAVGSSLARILFANGARVIAISTSIGAIYDPAGLDLGEIERLASVYRHRVVEEYPAERLPRESLLELEVDILCPCARNHSIYAGAGGNVARVKARFVCPGANNPITADAEAALCERGVTVITDFLCNCGGVLGGTMRFASVPRRKTARLVENKTRAMTEKLLAISLQSREPMRVVAERIALTRFERNRASWANRSGLFDLMLNAYRRGFIPGWLVGALSPFYFRRIAQI
jgi:glutamate dehydrogenase (NAD(P)+)